jgi:hypothetical protein
MSTEAHVAFWAQPTDVRKVYDLPISAPDKGLGPGVAQTVLRTFGGAEPPPHSRRQAAVFT